MTRIGWTPCHVVAELLWTLWCKPPAGLWACLRMSQWWARGSGRATTGESLALLRPSCSPKDKVACLCIKVKTIIIYKNQLSCYLPIISGDIIHGLASKVPKQTSGVVSALVGRHETWLIQTHYIAQTSKPDLHGPHFVLLNLGYTDQR